MASEWYAPDDYGTIPLGHQLAGLEPQMNQIEESARRVLMSKKEIRLCWRKLAKIHPNLTLIELQRIMQRDMITLLSEM